MKNNQFAEKLKSEWDHKAENFREENKGPEFSDIIG